MVNISLAGRSSDAIDCCSTDCIMESLLREESCLQFLHAASGFCYSKVGIEEKAP
jgi:hypothetical protein